MLPVQSRDTVYSNGFVYSFLWVRRPSQAKGPKAHENHNAGLEGDGEAGLGQPHLHPFVAGFSQLIQLIYLHVLGMGPSLH